MQAQHIYERRLAVLQLGDGCKAPHHSLLTTGTLIPVHTPADMQPPLHCPCPLQASAQAQFATQQGQIGLAGTKSRNDVAAYVAGSLKGAQVSDTQSFDTQSSLAVDAGQPKTLRTQNQVGVSANVLASDLLPGEPVGLGGIW